ncbi:GTPase Era, mitochondrial-like [Sinocyclocheilus rhinocerous]|uniref:GTPase Era, mitochondrial n=1 Tax=Sinocyclocheilus rhinocerous TaxID=307959 RepID=A0A673LSH1_9TELE|nr:PREDICTED: GTPase Era, mitochondrial-like [Sinocyclocheilus rhinocerous]
MTLRLCETILRRSLRFSAIRKLTAAPEQAPLDLRGSGCSVFGPQTVRKCLFHCTPASLVSSGTFLDRLQKGRAVLSDEGLCHHPVSVPSDSGHQFSLVLKDPDQPKNAKSLKVAIVGAPNAGKSTLTNQLLGRKLFAVSEKVHTTRSRAVGVLTQDDTQIILLDTPGLTTPIKAKRHHLEESLLVDPFESIKEADLVVVLVDVSDKWTRNKLDYEVLKCLALKPDVPVILVLNKVDLLKNKTLLLDITAQLTEGVVNGKIRIRGAEKPHQKLAAKPHSRHTEEPHSESMKDGASQEGQDKDRLSPEELKALKSRRGWPLFKDIFMLSSVDREDVETLKRYLFEGAKPGQWQYHSEVLTDQGPEEVCISTIREKLLQYLPKEVPYSMTQQIEIWKESEDGVLDISIKLYVKKDSHMKMVIGSGGHMITRITQEAENDLMKIFLREVRLKISAKLRK